MQRLPIVAMVLVVAIAPARFAAAQPSRGAAATAPLAPTPPTAATSTSLDALPAPVSPWLPEPTFAGYRRNAAACEASTIRSQADSRNLGMTIGTVGVLVAVAGLLPVWPHTEMTYYGPGRTTGMNKTLIIGGVAAWLGGSYLAAQAKVDPAVWENGINSLVVGTSTPLDVIRCLGNPATTTSGGDWSVMTYRAQLSGITQTYTLTFQGGVLSNVQRSSG